MMHVRHTSRTLFLCACILLLAGCARTQSASQSTTQEKAVNTTLSGTVTKTGSKFYISTPGKPATELDSYTIKLDESVGKKVSVTGQYSGTTLFVDKVE